MNTRDRFFNYQTITLAGQENVIPVEAEALAWGQQVLQSLQLTNLSPFEKAQRICAFLSGNFSYNFQRNLRVHEIIQKKGGNCVSHTLLGIFLLRLAGIPAKFAQEVHLTKPFRLISWYVGLWAKRAHDGINSFWHNDHVWVWFLNHGTWEPFDTALAVCGYQQFYEKRFFKHPALSVGWAQQWTGPPFVIWEDVGAGLVGLNNVTAKIIDPTTMAPLKHKEAWLALLALFEGWQPEDFHREYLPAPLLQSIKELSNRWFKQ